MVLTIFKYFIIGSSIFPFLHIVQVPITSNSLFSAFFTYIIWQFTAFFIWTLCTLENVANSDNFISLIESRPINLLSNNCLCYLQYSMKDINVIPIQCISLEWRQINSFILTFYNANNYIPSLMIRTVIIFTCFKFSR